MKKVFMFLLVVTIIYVLLLLIKVLFLTWKYKKISEINLSLWAYIKRDEDFKNLIWMLPLVLFGMFLVKQFYSTAFFVLVICAISIFYGAMLIFAGLKKRKTEMTELELVVSSRLKITAGIILFLFITAGYFWSRYLYNSFPEDIRPYVNLEIAMFVMLAIVLFSRRMKKPIRSNQYYRFTSVYLILSVILVILYWIYD